MKKILGFLFFMILLVTFFSNNIHAELVPDWVKNTAKWYGEGNISETEFLNAIKFLIKNNIIILDSNESKSDDADTILHNSIVIIPNGNALQSNVGFFIPLVLDVNVGTTVEWVNQDNLSHTVQSQDDEGQIIPVFNSDLIATGKSFTYTFDKPGVYHYFCTIHPWRVGAINVQ